jgi:hypothetical protein
MVVQGLMSDKGPTYKATDFVTVSGRLSSDADNTDAIYRTYFVDSLPNTVLYVRHRFLKTGKDVLFSQVMKTGAVATMQVLRSELELVRQGDPGHLHVFGLQAQGETLIDHQEFLQGQAKDQASTRWAFMVVGLVMTVGGLLFGISRLKAGQKPKGGRQLPTS